MPNWNPNQYLKFANERTQPAIDLVHRIQVSDPKRIIDLGCGPGNSTEVLRRRWPEAFILGVDNSAEMIDKARKDHPAEQWQVGDAGTWQTDETFDVVCSNAMLQWLPDHKKFCEHWFSQLNKGGALAVQIPAHYDSPAHKEIIAVSENPIWNDRLHTARAALKPNSPSFYYDVLQALASHVDIWESIYYHVLSGAEAVIEWFRGTALRTYFAALASDQERQQFEELLLARYQKFYPRQTDGKILFSFRRLFFVAYR